MKEMLVLLLSHDEEELRIINEALDESGARIIAIDDVATAIGAVSAEGVNLVVIGPSVSGGVVRWFVERMMASRTLREIPIVLMFYDAPRVWILEMIKLGVRAYIMLPREREDLRHRLIQHLPSVKTRPLLETQLSKPRESIGSRLRQRIAKRQMEQAIGLASPEAVAPNGDSIMLLDQEFTVDSGLLLRSSKRKITLYKKIDDYLLRLGGNHSHLISIFVHLLVVGKVRVAFSNKTERLSLIDASTKKTLQDAICLIDDYLRRAAAAYQPDTKTQKIIM